VVTAESFGDTRWSGPYGNSDRASNWEMVRNTEVRRRYEGNKVGGRACDNKVKSVRGGVGTEVHVLLKGENVKKVVK
jgi:hypothetical protein